MLCKFQHKQHGNKHPPSITPTQSYPQSYIILLLILNLKIKYDVYDILLKQLIHFRYNTCVGSY